MISKAIITKKISDYKYKVRIPTIANAEGSFASITDDDLPTALVCSTPGMMPDYFIGDVVYVSYEENLMDSPVIIGVLYREDGSKSTVDINAESLNVELNATLSTDTSIGNVSYDLISTLNSKDGTLSSQIDRISASAESLLPIINQHTQQIASHTQALAAHTTQITEINRQIEEDILPALPPLYKWKKYTIRYVDHICQYASSEELVDKKFNPPGYNDTSEGFRQCFHGYAEQYTLYTTKSYNDSGLCSLSGVQATITPYNNKNCFVVPEEYWGTIDLNSVVYMYQPFNYMPVSGDINESDNSSYTRFIQAVYYDERAYPGQTTNECWFVTPTTSTVDEFNTEHTYSRGNLVNKDSQLYICLQDNVVGEWDETKWSTYDNTYNLFEFYLQALPSKGDYTGVTVSSTNASAYPNSGEQDGYWYEKITPNNVV